MKKNIVEKIGGTVDVIGLDVIQLNTPIEDLSEENIKETIKKNIEESYDMVTINDEQFIIRATFTDLNKLNTILPEDMEQDVAMRIQFKIADMLKQAGLKVQDPKEMEDEARAEVDAEDNSETETETETE